MKTMGVSDQMLKAHLLAQEAERFHSLYTPIPESGCWAWLGYTNDQGYGSFWVPNRNLRAHRVSWVLHHGDITDGLLVLHKCDNPFCVNPDHLFLGTYKDNSDDRDMKKRTPLGSGRTNAKLTEECVRKIWAEWPGKSTSQIAREYNVHQVTISKIVRRAQWKHVV